MIDCAAFIGLIKVWIADVSLDDRSHFIVYKGEFPAMRVPFYQRRESCIPHPSLD
jgi:hypothetical protein